MQLEKPKFIDTEFVFYTEDGIQIKDNAPEWIKREYEKFKKQLNENVFEK